MMGYHAPRASHADAPAMVVLSSVLGGASSPIAWGGARGLGRSSRLYRALVDGEIAGYLNETALFRNQWQFRPESGGEKDDEFKARIRPILREQLAQAKAAGVLVPQVVYGYFAANAEGNDVVIWKDESRTAEWMRFPFPRQTAEPYLCIADFFRPVEAGELDYAAFHVVTMGEEVTEEALRLKAADRYQDYLFLHGLGVESTEALAEYWHRRIREEWGFADEDGRLVDVLLRQAYRGGRYSWGYPACPDQSEHEKVFRLLDAPRIGLSLSSGYALEPEQSTLAIVAHHPQAIYFGMKAGRLSDQPGPDAIIADPEGRSGHRIIDGEVRFDSLSDDEPPEEGDAGGAGSSGAGSDGAKAKQRSRTKAVADS